MIQSKPLPTHEPSFVDNPVDHYSQAYCRRCGIPFDVECPTCESDDCEYGEHTADRASQLERMRRLLMYAQEQRNTKYFLGCILMAMGDPSVEGTSLAEYARYWRVTRAAVSKHCVAICKFLGINPSAFMRSEGSRTQYKSSNRRPIKLHPK